MAFDKAADSVRFRPSPPPPFVGVFREKISKREEKAPISSEISSTLDDFSEIGLTVALLDGYGLTAAGSPQLS